MAGFMKNNRNPDEDFSGAFNGASRSPLGADWNKKRKLEDLELALPLPKLKCVVQSSNRCKDGSWSFGPESVESAVGIHTKKRAPETADYEPCEKMILVSAWSAGGCAKVVVRSEASGSCSGSNSYTGEYEATISLDIQREREPSASSKSCSRSALRSTACSLAGRRIQRKTEGVERAGEVASPSEAPKSSPKRLNCTDITDREMVDGNLVQPSKYQSEFPYTEDDPLLGLDINYADLIALEESQNADDDASLHLVDTFSPFYLMSSGRWRANEGTQEAERKPTIDQEFEQYFASLML